MAETIYTKYQNTYDYVLNDSANTLDTKNIAFLSGVQSELNKYLLNSGDVKSGTAKEGAFYLTTDTHRLYIGRTILVDNVQKTIPVPVNEGILTVATTSALSNIAAHVGEFYYVTGDNILCVYNGQQWVQINPDTNTNNDTKTTGIKVLYSNTVDGTYIKTADATIDNAKTYYTYNGSAFSSVGGPNATALNSYYEKTSNDGKSIVYSLILQQKDINRISNDESSVADIVTYFIINSSSLIATQQTGIVRSEVNNGEVTVQLSGGVADATKTIVLKGSSGISLVTTEDSNDITITGTPYRLERGTVTSNATSLKLKEGASDYVSTIDIKAGSNLDFDTSDSGIKIQHVGPTAAVESYQLSPDVTAVSGKTYYTRSGAGTSADPYEYTSGTFVAGSVYEKVTNYGNNTNTAPGEGAVIRVPKISKDANGHIANIEDIGITLPDGGNITAVTADSNGKIILTKKDTGTISSGNNSVLYYNITVDGTQSAVNNQGNLGSFYSATKVDALIENQLKGLNALVYKGTVGGQNSTVQVLPTSNVSIGDTYLVDSGVTELDYTGTSDADAVRPGDLLIAAGDEYALTSDAIINSTKTYYTRSGTSAPYTYTKVTSPVAANIGTYYENTGVIQSGTLTWTHIEAGDIDTKYDLAFTGNTVKLVENSNNKRTFELAAGNKISITPSTPTGTQDRVFTFNHAESGVIANSDISKVIGKSDTSGATPAVDTGSQSLNSGGSFVVPSIEVDRYGHITAGGNTTYTLPLSVNDTYRLKNTANPSASTPTYDAVLRLFKNTDAQDSITLSGDSTNSSATKTGIVITPGAGSIAINHATVTANATSSSTATADSTISTTGNNARKFTALASVTRDKFGHVTDVGSTTFIIPDYTHTLIGSAVTTSSGTKSIINTLKLGTDTKGTITYQSSTLNLTSNYSANSTATTYTIDLVWGSF